MEQEMDLVFVVAPEQEVIVAEESPVVHLIEKVVGVWDSVSVLKKSGLQMTPVQFRYELEKLGVTVCPQCSRYCLPDSCDCARRWSLNVMKNL